MAKPAKRIPSARIEAEHVRSAYRRWAPIYDFTFAPLTLAGRRQAARHINQRSGRVLEVGVGTGVSLGLYRPDLRIVGIDLSRDMLDKARARVARQRLSNVEAIREMDAAALEFTDSSFDIVVAMYVLTVVPEPERVMAELERVCRPGGEVILVNHFSAEGGPRAAIERGLSRFGPALGWHPEFSISTVLGRTGLELVERHTLAPFGVFTMLVLRCNKGEAAGTAEA